MTQNSGISRRIMGVGQADHLPHSTSWYISDNGKVFRTMGLISRLLNRAVHADGEARLSPSSREIIMVLFDCSRILERAYDEASLIGLSSGRNEEFESGGEVNKSLQLPP